MTDGLENEIARILWLKASKPVRRTDTLQDLCETLHGDARYGGPIDGEVAGLQVIYRN